MWHHQSWLIGYGWVWMTRRLAPEPDRGLPISDLCCSHCSLLLSGYCDTQIIYPYFTQEQTTLPGCCVKYKVGFSSLESSWSELRPLLLLPTCSLLRHYLGTTLGSCIQACGWLLTPSMFTVIVTALLMRLVDLACKNDSQPELCSWELWGWSQTAEYCNKKHGWDQHCCSGF